MKKKRGYLIELTEKLMAETGGTLSPLQLAEAANITRKHATMCIGRYRQANKRRVGVAAGSALDRLMPGPGLAKTNEERRFLAFVRFVGIARARELLDAEMRILSADLVNTLKVGT